MSVDVSYSAAVVAGVVSFLSPCVLPLVPPYLCFISGVSLEGLAAQERARDAKANRAALLAALMFVAGFTTVFVLLGAGASYAGQVLRTYLPILAQVAGVFIIIMGLNFLGVFRLGILGRDTRYQHPTRPPGLVGAYAVGLAFAFGWTPCIGPVLAAILSIAASEQSVIAGGFLLALYSLGLGIPFLIAAASVDRFLAFFGRFKRYLGRVEMVMGALLVVTGIMFLTGSMQTLSYWLLEQFPALGTIG
jgi:cytochrome c-type biogenesis protein